MMTPSQLREYEFKSAGRNAYKAEDVDAFFAEVLISYERMYRENSELIKRVSLLADRLEHYKKDEVDIKQAVLSAQKAADIIVRDAQMASEDAKAEAEAILAAAKGEAQIIKDDAERQAIADSDLLMSVARDKAEEILNKAKEKAHGILIAANDSASDAMGAANRTVTSESLHYEMLKKEVAEFRASILSQYRAHIELISKLPAIADEQAAKIENPPVKDDIDMEKIEKAYEDNDTVENTEGAVLEYVEKEAKIEIIDDNSFEAQIPDVKDETLTEKPADKPIAKEKPADKPVAKEKPADKPVAKEKPADKPVAKEKPADKPVAKEKPADKPVAKEKPADKPIAKEKSVEEPLVKSKETTADDNINNKVPADIPITKGFAVSTGDIQFDGFEDIDSGRDDDDSFDESEVETVIKSEIDNDIEDDTEDDSVESSRSFFDTIESISTDDEEEQPKKRGFFGLWK